jgi:uncharacterized protein (DUF2147 family)
MIRSVRKFVIASLAPASLVSASLAFVPAVAAATAAESVHGVWMRGGHTEKLEFFDCGGKLCARGVIPLPDGSPPPLVLRHAPKVAPNQWKGDLFNPENGKTYTGTITLESPTQLTLSGCLVAFLCQTETWTKVPSAKPPKKQSPASVTDH